MHLNSLAFAATLTLTLGATVANAHPKLLAASPAAGGVSAGSPRAIRMTFSEPIFPKLSGLTLRRQGGGVVKTAAASVDPANRKQLVTPLAAALKAGRYRVAWHAVSTDTHRVQGQFDFTVK